MAFLVLPSASGFSGHYIRQMFAEVVERPRPGCSICFGTIAIPAFAVKGVAGVGIKIKLVGLS